MEMWKTTEGLQGRAVGSITWALVRLGKFKKLGAIKKNFKVREFFVQDELGGEPFVVYFPTASSDSQLRKGKGRINLMNWHSSESNAGLPLDSQVYPVRPSTAEDAEETDLEIVTPGRTYILRAESKIQMRAPPCPMLML